MQLFARLFGKGVESNPDVKPQNALEKSVVRFWIAYLVGMGLQWVIDKVTGVQAPWVPWVAGALRGVLDTLRATYKVDPTTPPAPAPPP